MKAFLVLPIIFSLLAPIKILASQPSKISDACESFAAGEIDAYKTLETLNLKVDHYSIGVFNTAKIFCT
tara:strand:+ start:82 stop:288 length:207 start_codon:yes stop_codon:yes gene_type:complete